MSSVGMRSPPNVLGVGLSREFKTPNDHLPIVQYRVLVERLVRDFYFMPRSGPHSFKNRGVLYAKAVMDALIENAQQSVTIFSKQLNADVYDASLIKSFLKRAKNPKCEIVVEVNDPGSKTPSALANLDDELKRGQVRLYRLQHIVPDSHFAIIDDVNLRLETSQENKEALVILGAPKDLVKNVRNTFESLVKGCQSVNC